LVLGAQGPGTSVRKSLSSQKTRSIGARDSRRAPTSWNLVV